MAEINQSRSRKAWPKIDMTPMVDLAFLLLTFFMLTTTFNKVFVMPIAVPEKAENVKQPEINHKQVVTLILGSDDKIYWYRGKETVIEQTDYSSGGIRSLLQNLKTSIKDMYVFIKPSDESRYQNLVDILDEMTIGNIDRYALVDITSTDINLIKTKTNQHE